MNNGNIIKVNYYFVRFLENLSVKKNYCFIDENEKNDLNIKLDNTKVIYDVEFLLKQLESKKILYIKFRNDYIHLINDKNVYRYAYGIYKENIYK
jgi:hypothetical protein